MMSSGQSSLALITLENRLLKVVVSAWGGHIESIYHKPTARPYYWQYQRSVWPRRTSICFPICGALPDDTYLHGDKKYSMPMHGFLREQQFTIVEQHPDAVVMETCSNERTARVFPFSYRFRLTYRLIDHRLQITYIIENTAAFPLLFSTGSHYTYLLEDNSSNYQLTFDGVTTACLRQVAGQYLLPERKNIALPDHIPLSLTDGSSYILQYPKDEVPLVTLRHKHSGYHLVVRFTGFEYCLFWRPGGNAEFLCIEPWSGIQNTVDSGLELADKTSITHLTPGRTGEFSIEIMIGGA